MYVVEKTLAGTHVIEPRRGGAWLLVWFLVLAIGGCAPPEISRADQEHIREGNEAIERIKANRSIPTEHKRTHIKRIQMEVQELTGKRIGDDGA